MKFLTAFILFFIGLAGAVAAKPITATYGIYAGGFNVTEVQATFDHDGQTYKIDSNVKTTGILGTLAPWAGEIITEGKVVNGAFLPQNHIFQSTWRDETKRSVFTFDKSGALQHVKRVYDDGSEKDRTPGNDVLKDNPVDMLTTLMKAMTGETCAGVTTTLDTKRRFDMIFTLEDTVNLSKNKYNIYEGSAEICSVEIKPIAGKWREKPRGWMSIQEQSKSKGDLPRLWFGSVNNASFKIPVRMLVKTNYGAVVMHLTDVK